MSNRYYPDHDLGLAYPSVTTILDVIAKPGLIAWYKKLAAKEIEQISEEAADLGTRVHSLIEKRVNFKIQNNNSDAAEIYNIGMSKQEQVCYEAFMNWEDKNHVKYLMSECKVLSKEWQYGGRFDILANVNGDLSLIDIKTSKAFYDTMGLQLSAYAQAFHENYPDYDYIQKHYILRLDKEKGTPHFKEYPYDFKTFLNALNLWKWSNKWSDEKAKEKYKEGK